MRRLHLGAGRDLRTGWVDLDVAVLPGLDVVADLEAGLPFADGVFDEIFASHVLEHVEDLAGLLAELHRVCRCGARVRVEVPHLSYYGAYTDPTHRRFFGYRTFDYFTDEGPYIYYSNVRFRIRRREIRFFWRYRREGAVRSRLVSAWINRFPGFYERFLCWMLPANEICFELEPVKPAASPEGRDHPTG